MIIKYKKKAKLNLCDLAGSEKINKKNDISKDHLNELKNINKSLTTLGNISVFLRKMHKFFNFEKLEITSTL